MTTETIYQEATRRQRLIRSLHVKYVVTVEQTLALPNRPLGSMNATKKFEYTFMGDKRLLRKDFEYRQPMRNLKSIDLYTTNESVEYKSGVLRITDTKKHNLEGAEVYCRHILQIPLSDAEQAQYDNEWFYPHVLREIGGRSKYQLLPNQEQVDGERCFVVEYSGFDKIWIDPNLEYMFRQRERFGPVAVGQSVPRYRYDLRDFKLVSGIWVPMSCTITNYILPHQPKEYWGKEFYKQDIKIEDIEINKVTDKDFDFEVPAGTVLLRGHGGAQRLPGEKTELLSQLGLLAQEHKPAKVATPEPRNTP